MKIDLRINGNTDYGFDVSELAHNIDYSTSLKGYAGKLTFKLKKDPYGDLKMNLGDEVEFRFENAEVFKGYILI